MHAVRTGAIALLISLGSPLMANPVETAAPFLPTLGASSPPAQPRPAGTTRTDLQRHDLATPGQEVLQARIEFAPASSFPRHAHPGEEIIYVLEGSLDYEVDGKWSAHKAGDVLFIPAGTVHAARNTGTVKAAELATYFLEKGKPLTKIVE